MFSSENKNTGFSAIEQEELENVNGGIIPAITAFGVTLLVAAATGVAVTQTSKSK